MKKITKLRFAGALAAGLGLSALGLGGIASTATGARGAPTTIKIVGSGHQGLRFEAPNSVDEDTILRIVNKTNPQQVGPHTFSLVRHFTYPGPRELRDCERLKPGTICREIAQWHDALGQNPQNNVDVKAPGWDKMGNFQDTGDSWLTDERGQEELRTVSHESKGKLHFICAVHPTMRGKIDVNQFKGT